MYIKVHYLIIEWTAHVSQLDREYRLFLSTPFFCSIHISSSLSVTGNIWVNKIEMSPRY